MKETRAGVLALDFDPLDLTVDNYNFGVDPDLAVVFPAKCPLKLVAFSCSLAVGYGGSMP